MINPVPYIYVIMTGSPVQMVQFWFIIEKMKSVFNTFLSLYTVPKIFFFCHIFLTLKMKQIDLQSISSDDTYR